MNNSPDELAWLMSLVDEIGGRIERGQLPPQDSSGRYLLGGAASDVARTVAEGAMK